MHVYITFDSIAYKIVPTCISVTIATFDSIAYKIVPCMFICISLCDDMHVHIRLIP